MKTILFQGDSVTDAGRDKEYPDDLGKGYPNLVAARLGLDRPGEYRFVNRGVNGNRIVDIYARIKRDILNVHPDFLSILVGVNDAWHEFDCADGVDCEKFRKIYRMLLEEIMEALPDVRILLLEPYIMLGSATASYYAELRAETELRAAAVRDLAREFSLPFIPLQQPLDELTAHTPTEFFLKDGVHPHPAFHQYIADQWLKTFQTLQ